MSVPGLYGLVVKADRLNSKDRLGINTYPYILGSGVDMDSGRM